MSSARATDRWIQLEGAVNVRDLGGLPAGDGAVTRPNRLIRSDNLQALTAGDVQELVDRRGVRSVADLRTSVEVRLEGPGPLTREPRVRIENLSLFPEAGHNTDAAALDEDAPVVMPWQDQPAPARRRERGAAEVYLGYLEDRADSVVSALRLVARTDGATIVHCAAGKDRTGVVVAFALTEVGVERDAIIEDYALSAERIEAIFARLRASRTYADDLADQPTDRHRTRAETMHRVLTAMDEVHGGVPAWLRGRGWTEADAATLRAQLLD